MSGSPGVGTPAAKGTLRIALLTYRGNPRCGGQGVYCHHLSRSLRELGHCVTVFSGQPYPNLVEGVDLVRVPSLDLYRDSDPFRSPRRREINSLADLGELAIMRAGGFPEARTFGMRVRRELESRRGSFDIVHDNQSLSHSIGRLATQGWPVVASIHHPIAIDRALDLHQETRFLRRLAIRRWYGFAHMQSVVARSMPKIVTVSSSSRQDIVREYGIDESHIAVIPVGVDSEVFRPYPEIQRIPGRIMTTASADVPLKGLVYLLEALAKVRTEYEDAHLVVVGRLRQQSPILSVLDRLGISDAVAFVSGESDQRIAQRYAEASCAVVPSLYEGFSLPAIEAMACRVPLIATAGGALPEVVGTNGATALLVPPADAGALASAITRVMREPRLGDELGAAGRDRVLALFSWRACAEQTAQLYRTLLAEQR